MLIDSGSDITLINAATTRRINLRYKLPPKPTPRIIGANGRPIKMLGIVPNACIDTPQEYLLDTVWVTANLNTEAILGQSSLAAFKSLTMHYGGNLSPLTVQNIASEANSSFTTHPPVRCFLSFDLSQAPLRAPSRRQNSSNRVFISQEVKHLFNEGKIRPSCSSWRSQAFVREFFLAKAPHGY